MNKDINKNSIIEILNQFLNLITLDGADIKITSKNIVRFRSESRYDFSGTFDIRINSKAMNDKILVTLSWS